MKMTLHIDDNLLDRVMKATNATSKTRAIDIALREMDRRAELMRLSREGLGMSAEELRESYDPISYATSEEPPKGAVKYAIKSRAGR